MKKSTTSYSFKDHWKDDLKAGFNVSLIALPLSLGIALASGFPPIAGLFAAIIGGLLVSRINGSFVTIVGPAAGLIVVNLTAIEMLGQGDNAAGYKYALAAICVSGVFIFLLGLLKAGKFGDFFPSSAVHGMLAAIGIIIMVKQLFVSIAVRAHGHEFYEILEEIPVAIRHANPEVIIITLVSLAILILHPKIKNQIVKAVPAPIWVLAVAIPLEFLLDFEHSHEVIFLGEHHKVGPQLLVHLPDNIADGFAFPDFGKLLTSAFWISVMTITLVTALESVLSAIAVDSLDPAQRKTNLNKDLRGLGVGTSVSGLVGGLPMISEIVRSSANVSSGAKTQWANFFHGGFLLIFLLVGGPVINHIPLSALAAMLLFTGFRLASPKEFKHVAHIGKMELAVFVFTIIMVLVTDLLIGVGAGMLLNLIINIFRGTSVGNLFKVKVTEEENGNEVILKLSGAVVFSNYLGLKSRVIKHQKKNVTLDMGAVTFVDHSAMHHFHKLEMEFHANGLEFQLINDDYLKQETSHPLSARMSKTGAAEDEKILTSHQTSLKAYARSINGLFTPESVARGLAPYKKFLFSRSGSVQHLLNVIKGETSSIHFQYAEIDFDDDITTKSSSEVFPSVLISHVAPQFTLEKEGFFDKIAGIAGYEDIDFENHPVFSDTFLLRGNHENEIRNFFTSELIQYLEEHPAYHVESNGEQIIIYGFDRSLSTQNSQDLLQFSAGLIQVISENKLELAN